MSRKRRSEFRLTDEELDLLRRISRSRTEPSARVERAKILLAYRDGFSVTEIAKQFGTNRPRIERTIDRAIRVGVVSSLDDLPRAGRPRRIGRQARSWILSLACQKPKDLGYAAETWTARLLAKHIRSHSEAAGYPELTKISPGTISKILAQAEIRPHTIRYYVERRDPLFERKMAQVLHLYQEVQLCSKLLADGVSQTEVFLSYDEKPGIQAIRNVAPDRMPVPGQHPNICRDYEYQRLGTVSLLASIDLITGRVHAQVQDRHRSREFVEHLRQLDAYYPKGLKIKIVLDNHSSHTSKETQEYLKTVPNRFEFIFTPTHGSWLNLIETFFSKLARCVLRGIRVESTDELKARILQGIDEINAAPIVHKWHYHLEEAEIATKNANVISETVH